MTMKILFSYKISNESGKFLPLYIVYILFQIYIRNTALNTRLT